uniref:IKBKB interacting protein n=1 Tax=Gouania willdenowi TaxID=441366 RepID=A0A8C5DXF7_GOUWI
MSVTALYVLKPSFYNWILLLAKNKIITINLESRSVTHIWVPAHELRTPVNPLSVHTNGSSSSVLRLQLVASEDDLQEALRAVAMATKLQQEVSALHASALQAVNTHFMNVTETWQERLASINSDLSALKAESREGHASATEQVNEAERRARLLAERLEELEDSTSRNARALQRTEDDDAKKAQDQLDWNTKQIHKLDQEVGGLSRREAELHSQLQELVPRAQQCDEQLPQVEEAVRSILRLGGDLSGAEQRLEELTLQKRKVKITEKT